ncbi:Structure-specific endonuclease subunit SLX1 [Rhizophlyctis rosea]|nr:Structure-specific endonuclease subunit SLX1 [Rhizophlyctis rosea]
MLLFVHGFPNKYAALQFEWAWQFPHLSRHFKSTYPGAYTGTPRERLLPTKLRVLSDMFHLSHWSRWPLRIHFLNSDIALQFSALPTAPPKHIDIKCGPMESVQHEFADLSPEDHAINLHTHITKLHLATSSSASETDCIICLTPINIEQPTEWVTCTRELCPMLSHLVCLSEWFLAEEGRGVGKESNERELLPVVGTCPLCREEMRWGEVVRDVNERVRSFEVVAGGGGGRGTGGRRKDISEEVAGDEGAIGEEENDDDDEELEMLDLTQKQKDVTTAKVRNCMTRDFVREATRGVLTLSQTAGLVSEEGGRSTIRVARVLEAVRSAAAAKEASRDGSVVVDEGGLGGGVAGPKGKSKPRGRPPKGPKTQTQTQVGGDENHGASTLSQTGNVSPTKRKRGGVTGGVGKSSGSATTTVVADSDDDIGPSTSRSRQPRKPKTKDMIDKSIIGDVRDLCHIPSASLFSDPLLDSSDEDEEELMALTRRVAAKGRKGKEDLVPIVEGVGGMTL